MSDRARRDVVEFRECERMPQALPVSSESQEPKKERGA